MPDRVLARGPGLVGACFGVDPSWTGADLCNPESPLRLERGPDDRVADADVEIGPRIGIAYAGDGWADRPWRFWLRDHPSVTVRR
jgi:DNA-3-methyladenine glycosylase